MTPCGESDEYFQRTDSNGPANFLTDALGSTLALTDSSGNALAQYTFEPFGNATISGASANPYQYSGRENDGTGVHFYRGRYYNPTFQRFVSQDPIGIAGGINLYAYASNNPIGFRDPFGTSGRGPGCSAFYCSPAFWVGAGTVVLTVAAPEFLVRLNPGETKNGRGRVIPLGQELLDVLKSQLHLRNTHFPECPLVFFRMIKTKTNPVPSWVPVGDIRKAFEAGCTKAGLPGLIFHDLRRSAIRNMVRAGVQERVAMRLSGHLTRAVFDRYNIVSDQDLTEAVQRLQKFQETAVPLSQPPRSEPVIASLPARFVN